MSSWGVLKPMLVPVLVVTVVAIITVMAVTGQASQIIIRADKKRELRKAQRNEVNTMNDFFQRITFLPGVTLKSFIILYWFCA